MTITPMIVVQTLTMKPLTHSRRLMIDSWTWASGRLRSPLFLPVFLLQRRAEVVPCPILWQWAQSWGFKPNNLHPISLWPSPPAAMEAWGAARRAPSAGRSVGLRSFTWDLEHICYRIAKKQGWKSNRNLNIIKGSMLASLSKTGKTHFEQNWHV